MSENFERRRFERPNENNFETVSENPEFQRLLDGFREWKESEPDVEEPLIHGTGSYALKRIIKNGFKPQRGDMILQGERTAHGDKYKDKVVPVSFAIKSPKAEKVSHLYATWPTNELNLSFNSENELGDDRLERVVHDVYGGLEAIAIRRAMQEADSKPNEYEDDEELTRDDKIALAVEEMKIDIEHKFNDRRQKGANTFNPQRMKERKDRLEEVINGSADPQEAELLLRDTQILNKAKHYYAATGNITPLYKTREVVTQSISDITDEDTKVGNLAKRALAKLNERIGNYERLPAAEREELENQFPCYVTIEGKDLDTQLVDWMEIIQEVQCDKTVSADRIREIQVPENKVEEVEGWLADAKLEKVKVVPFEYYEMQEVIEKRT